MEVDRTALWILMGAFSATGVTLAIRAQLRAAPPVGRLARAGRLAGAVLTGVGLGLSAALAMLVLAALMHGLRGL